MGIQQINLFNPDFVPRRDLTTARYLGMALAVILAAAAAGVWATTQFGDGLTAEERRLGTEMESLRQQTDALTVELNSRKVDATLEKQLEAQRVQLRERQQVSRWLHAQGVSESSAVSDYLRALARQTLDGVWLTQFELGAQGGSLRIEGRALHGDLVPRYLGKLGEEALLKGRTFARVSLDRDPQPASAASSGEARSGASLPEGMTFRLETVETEKGAPR